MTEKTRVSGHTSRGQRAQSKRRRVLFNCDGSSVFLQAGDDLNKWIENVFTGLEDSHVDALLWCDGAGGNTATYDSQVLELTGKRIGKVSPFLLRLIEEGDDPPKVVVREARKRGLDVFYSFRINDIHDDFMPEEFPTFKEQRPEWLIGEGHPYGRKTALNFAVPEVRRLKFAVIEEIFRKYDFDGLEIDFMRSPPFFVPGEEEKQAHILTQFLREVRQHLDRRGEERGRPVELAARVDESLEACHLDAFEVETWVKGGLIDILILGSGVMDIEVEEFKRVVGNTGVLVYPCLYGWPSGYMPISPELARGLALNYWHQGADGIYTFNWFPHESDKTYQIPLLKEIGDPNELHLKPMAFAADRGVPSPDYPHNWMHCALPAELVEGKAVEVPILVCEDLSLTSRGRPPQGLDLRVQCEGLAAEDTLEITLNGNPLAVEKGDASSLTAALTPNQVVWGRNLVALRLTRGASQGQAATTVKAVEIHVAYA